MKPHLSAKFFAAALALAAYSAHALDPVPSFYQEPGLSPNRATLAQQMQEHIDPFTGKLQLHAVDLHIPGNGGLDINVQRSYSSINEQLSQVEETLVGVGWTMHFGRVLRRASLDICDKNVSVPNAPVLELPDGGRQILYVAPDQSHWLTTTRWKAQCSTAITGGLNVYAPDGTLYELTTPGQTVGATPATRQRAWYATRITDRNGNRLDFQYVSVGTAIAVSNITASDGRVINFAYAQGRLSSISDGTRTWRYEYELTAGPTYPLLSKVVRPDGEAWSFEYNGATGLMAGAYSLKKIVYPTGGSYSYTYGFVTFNINLPKTTVVTGKASSRNETWRFSYTPASVQCGLSADGCRFDNPASYDLTVVDGPDGRHEFAHVGANSVMSGLVWAVGLALHKDAGNGYATEEFVWDRQTISNMVNIRSGNAAVFDSGIYAPVLDTKVLARNGAVHQTTYSNYDAYGNPGTIVETGPNGNGGTVTRRSQITYDIRPAKWLIRLPKTETTDTIGTVSRDYDANGNVTSESRYGVTTRFTYFATGDLETKTNARGKQTRYGDYKRGVPRSENHPQGVVYARTVSDAGDVLSETDGEGSMIAYQYDDLSRITRIEHPMGSPVTVSWAQKSRSLTRGSYAELTEFDEFGRPSQITHRGGASGALVQTYAYDAVGRRTFASYPDSSTGTHTKYDILGRPYRVTHEADSSGNGTVSKSTFYDTAIDRVSNENLKSYSYAYRSYGNPEARDLMSIDAPDSSANVVITRNGLGQLLSITQGGKRRSFEYDSRYFLVGSDEPEIGRSVFGRDAVGNMTSRQVGSSSVTSYVSDDRDRLEQVNYPAGTSSVRREYYRDDRLKSVSNGDTTRSYQYDDNKRLTQETLVIGTKIFTTKYGYNGNDALDVITYPFGGTVTLSPDALGRPTKAIPYVTAVAHHPNGAVKSLTYANGVRMDSTQNGRLWLESMQVTKSGNSLSSLAYGYDNVGNVTRIKDPVNSDLDRLLDYDAIDRVTNLDGPWGTGGRISYDGQGNILSQRLGLTQLNYSYDPTSNRLKSVSGSRTSSFEYDAYGNVTASGANRFRYNDAQQMECAQCGQANEVSYVYDGMGMRVSKKFGTETTYYVYGAGGNLLTEVGPRGEVKEFIYVDGKQVAVRNVNP